MIGTVTTSPHQVLTVLIWFMIIVLITLLMLVARMYWRVEGERTYFAAFVIPLALMGIGSARYAYTDTVGGDPLGDVCWLLAGLLLIVHSLRLRHQMLSGTTEPERDPRKES